MCSLNEFSHIHPGGNSPSCLYRGPSHCVSRDWIFYSRNFKVRMFQNMEVKNNGIQNVFRVKKKGPSALPTVLIQVAAGTGVSPPLEKRIKTKPSKIGHCYFYNESRPTHIMPFEVQVESNFAGRY